MISRPRAPLIENVLEQRARDRSLRRFDRAIFAGGGRRAHHRHAHLGHYRTHVGEIEIDEAVHGDELRDSAHRLQQHVVGFLERFPQRRIFAGDREQALIGNRDQRVDGVLQLAQSFFSLSHAAAALELKRLGHDADGQRAEFARDARNHWRRAGSGATAHSGGDEHHLGFRQHFADALFVFERGLASDFRIAAGAASARNLGANLHAHRRVVILQRLDVGIDGDEIDVAQAHIDHVVDRIAAASASADYLDPRTRVGITHQLNHHRSSSTTYRQSLLPI